VYVEGT